VLEVRDLCAGYYSSSVLRNVSLTCSEGVSLVIGPNGAGKSTLVKSLVGLIRPVSGKVSYLGKEIGKLNARDISLLGITTVPERARLFSSMTVLDNLKVGYSLLESRRKLDALGQASWQGRGKDFGGMLGFVVETFPDLSGRLKERAGKLSGGQQQMLAIARALISAPRFLIMDEPTTGLYPALVKELVTKIRRIAQGMPILLTEQNIAQTLPLASYVYLLESGRIVLQGRPEEILNNERARRAYLGDVRSQAGATQKRG
jgi:branched-chain amino acid transport system ATP-binding protein